MSIMKTQINISFLVVTTQRNVALIINAKGKVQIIGKETSKELIEELVSMKRALTTSDTQCNLRGWVNGTAKDEKNIEFFEVIKEVANGNSCDLVFTQPVDVQAARLKRANPTLAFLGDTYASLKKAAMAKAAPKPKRTRKSPVSA